MPELTGRERLRVHVGEFLELECTLQRHRVPHVTPQEQHGACIGQGPSRFTHRVERAQDLLDLLRHRRELGDDRVDLVGGLRLTILRQIQADQIAHSELGEEGLGGRHTDLGPGVGVQNTVGLTRDG